MVNNEFVTEHSTSTAIFLPNVVSDHCPMVLHMSTNNVPKSKPFRFANYIGDKPEFEEIVKNEWHKRVIGSDLNSILVRMKRMKVHMKQLNWKHGNLFDKVVLLRNELKEVQQQIDKYPFNIEFRVKAADVLMKYNEAIEDEGKLLFQKAKINWLKEGDRNSKYFHKVIKGRSQKSRIDSICNEMVVRFEGSALNE